MDEGTIFLVLALPRPWPPPIDVELYSQSEGGNSILLGVDKSGRFTLGITSSDDEIKRYRFQPVVIEGSGRVILSISWTIESISLRLNGKEILLDEDAHGKSIVIKTKDDPVTHGKLIFEKIDPDVAKSEEEYLFLATAIDIDQKVIEGSRYSLIRAAGLLRQLLLDSSPLVHVVNRKYKLKITFETSDFNQQPPIKPSIHHINLDVSAFPGAKTIQVNLNHLLKAPVFENESVTASVHDLILACANAMGGIHLGKTRTSEEKLILDWDQIFRVLGDEPSLRTIAGVCRVVLRGIKPLVDAINNQPDLASSARADNSHIK